MIEHSPERGFGNLRAEREKLAGAATGQAPPAPGEPGVSAEPVEISRLRERFPESVLEVISFRGEWTAIVRPKDIVGICAFLRDDPGLAMDYLVDVCAIHWMDRDYEHEVVYLLHSYRHNRRIRLKCRLAPAEAIATLTGIYPGANWHEREAYDLVGVRFAGHPDLRRILMPEDYDAHPLRKDFPVKGI